MRCPECFHHLQMAVSMNFVAATNWYCSKNSCFTMHVKNNSITGTISISEMPTPLSDWFALPEEQRTFDKLNEIVERYYRLKAFW